MCDVVYPPNLSCSQTIPTEGGGKIRIITQLLVWEYIFLAMQARI